MDRADSSRLLARLSALLLLGICFAFWPLAGYAASVLATESADGVDEVAQASFLVDKTPNTTLATVGATITYTYRLTNTGTITFESITAVDDRLGSVTALEGLLAPGIARTAVLTYVVLASDGGTNLENTVTVTGTFTGADGEEFEVGFGQATVEIEDPTGLPPTEQPNQPGLMLFLPSVRQPE